MNNLTDNSTPYFWVACLFYEICGASIQMDESEYNVYGDDWMCHECYDQHDMFMFGWETVSE